MNPRFDDRHTVYRFYDETDRLLYVGVSKQPLNRIAEQHGRTSDWWFEATYILLEHCADKNEALDLEAIYINTCEPKYNRQRATRGIVRPTRPRDPHPVERAA